MSGPKNPKAFISYSWSSPNHQNWVLELATSLRENGVDVLLDKWELREGHDKNAFMEKLVSDPAVTKVVMICDKVYAEKADDRLGGVGTEAQIISAELYGKSNQDKFCAVLSEVDVDGRPYLPVYYKSRIYIDLSGKSLISLKSFSK
jgi:SEFIR domain